MPRARRQRAETRLQSIASLSDRIALGGPQPQARSLTTVPTGDVTTEVMLAPSAAAVGASAPAPRESIGPLAVAIQQRIETRLNGRIRNLHVRVREKTVVLEGSCATYYSKQLAQHAALGVIEDEQLENEIIVALPE